MNRSLGAWLVAAVLLAPACRTGRPVIGSDANDTAAGTIGGVLQGPQGGDPLPGRRVEAVSETTSTRYSAVTNVTGGFTIQVPPGKYRLQVELREGERLVKDPGTIDINPSDLDANIMVEVGELGPPVRSRACVPAGCAGCPWAGSGAPGGRC